jgi:hypothetical protein
MSVSDKAAARTHSYTNWTHAGTVNESGFVTCSARREKGRECASVDVIGNDEERIVEIVWRFVSEADPGFSRLCPQVSLSTQLHAQDVGGCPSRRSRRSPNVIVAPEKGNVEELGSLRFRSVFPNRRGHT